MLVGTGCAFYRVRADPDRLLAGSETEDLLYRADTDAVGMTEINRFWKVTVLIK